MGKSIAVFVRSRGATVAAATLVAVLSLAPLGCRRGAKAPAAATSLGASPVETAVAVRGDAARWTAVTGSLVAMQDLPLSAKSPGRLAAVYVREGDVVGAGQVVAALDMTDQQSSVRSAEAAVAVARAKLAQADAAYRQQKASSRSGLQAAEAVYRQQTSSSGAVVRSAEAAYEQQLVTTKANIESAQAALAAARAQLSQVREGARTQEVRRAETQVAIAKANLSKANKDRERYSKLAAQGAVGKATVEQYETNADVARENLAAAEQALSLLKEGARSQEITQAEQAVRQAEERLRQAQAAAALDKVREADVQTARAALAQNDVRRADVEIARAGLSQIDVRRADVLAARAAVRQAQSALAIARKALADAFIRSPISGLVAERHGEPGQVVGAGSPVLRVVDLGSVYFEPNLPDRDLRGVGVGQVVEVRVKAFPGRVFSGRIAKIYPAASAASRAFPIRVTVANASRELRPGMFAEGRIECERHREAVLIPEAALLAETDQGGEAKIFVVKDGTAHEQVVTIGLKDPARKLLEVTGLAPGSEVVTSGQRALKEGDKVTASRPTGGEATAADGGAAPQDGAAAPQTGAAAPQTGAAAESGR